MSTKDETTEEVLNLFVEPYEVKARLEKDGPVRTILIDELTQDDQDRITEEMTKNMILVSGAKSKDTTTKGLKMIGSEIMYCHLGLKEKTSNGKFERFNLKDVKLWPSKAVTKLSKLVKDLNGVQEAEIGEDKAAKND